MKKIALLSMLISAPLIPQQIIAEDEVSKKDELLLQGSYSPDVSSIGLELSTHAEVKSENSVQTNDATIMIRPTLIESSSGQSTGNNIKIDLLGTMNKKAFTTKTGILRPYFQSRSSALTYSHDGQPKSGSFTLLDMGGGAGVQLDLGKNSYLSAHAGVGVGLEIGKRDGIFDPSFYAQSELNINDVLRVVGDAEVRMSAFSTGYESSSGIETSLQVNDRIRVGLELDQSTNRLADGSRYDSTYGGITIGGTWGGKSKSR